MRRAFLKPIAPWAFVHSLWDLVSLLAIVCNSIAFITHKRCVSALQLLAAESSPSTVALAVCVFVLKVFVILGCAVYCFHPETFPLDRPLHGPLVYRRFHSFHIRLDRLTRMVRANKTSCSLSSTPYRQSVFCSASTSSLWSAFCMFSTPFTYAISSISWLFSHSTPVAYPTSPVCDNASAPFPRLDRLTGGGKGEAPSASRPASPEVLELYDSEDDTTAFIHGHWIGCGKTWADKMPRSVKNARDAARQIPAPALKTITRPSNLTVSEILSQVHALPPPSNSFLEPQFDPLPPNILLDPSSPRFATETREIALPILIGLASHPKDAHLSFLRSRFDNAWLSGVRSIRVSDNPELRLPLWTENLLAIVATTTKKQKCWRDAMGWLTQVKESISEFDRAYDLVEACEEEFSTISWDAIVPGFSRSCRLTTFDLARFLSSDWLNDEMVNAGSDFIMRRMGINSRVRIANVLFMDALRSARAVTPNGPYKPRRNSLLDNAILGGDVDVLEVPVNPGQVHWAGIKINIDERSFSYRDGYNPNRLPSADDIKLLVWYLDTVRPSSCTTSLHTLRVPRQWDGDSCGIVLLSELAAEYLGYTHWSQQEWMSERMEWWLRLHETLKGGDDEDSSADGELSHFITVTSQATGLDLEPLDKDSDDFGGYLDSVELIPASQDTSPVDDSTSAPFLFISKSLEPALSSPATSSLPLSSPGVTSPSNSETRPLSPPPSSAAPEVLASQITKSSTTSRKRPHAVLDHSDGEASDSQEGRRIRSRTSGTKAGSSWAKQKALKATSKSSSFKVNPAKFKIFKEKILDDDKRAKFKTGDACKVWCSACTKWIEMRALYDTIKWTVHRGGKACLARQRIGLSQQQVGDFFAPRPPTTCVPRAETPLEDPSCPGLSRDVYPLVRRYLRRVTSPGGGAPNRHRIALSIKGWKKKLGVEGCRYKNLSEERQRIVLRLEETLYAWRNIFHLGTVVSTRCTETASFTKGPCDHCSALLSLHTFQNQLNTKLPKEENMKFVPKAYRSTELGEIYLKYKGVRQLLEADDGHSVWLRFAKGVVDGHYESSQVALGMVEAMLKKRERLAKGKSLKNMQYTEALDSFSMLLASISTRAYKTFRHQFGGRTVRSIQYLRAKQRHFQPDFADVNFQQAADCIKALNYSGPFSLAWDDTDLEKALSVWQETKKAWLVVGGTNGVIRVESEEEIDAIFENAKIEKADKLRIWVLIFPLPNVPPLLLVAHARASKLSAEELSKMHFKITEKLHAVGVHPISFAADGTETERGLQRIIAASASSTFYYSIPNESPGCTLEFSVPLYHGQHPGIEAQDSKHAAKTARNQLLSGARLLVLGNFVMFFKMLRDIAEHVLGPLFKRDIEGLDRQDDRAAARLFSSETLDFNLKTFPQHTGLSAYLFVLGELIDAWQNRHIPHLARIKMVLRARFFLMVWRAHIVQHPDHRTHIHFISRESFDIFLTLCDSLIQLIVIHRKWYPDYPLLPWLHSTETCEHIFGMLRQLKQSFSFVDVLYLEPRLRALMLGAFKNLSPEEQANATASGYHHTYFNASDINLSNLMKWPNDVEIQQASADALIEVERLLSALGIDARQMLALYKAPAAPKTTGMPESEPVRPQTLHDLMQLFQRPTSAKDDDRMEACEMALAADDIDQTLGIISLPETSEADESNIKASIEEICEAARTVPAAPITPATSSSSNGPLELVDPLTLQLDRVVLSSTRLKSQPAFVKNAVRRAARLTSQPSSTARGVTLLEDLSIRDRLLQRISSLAPPNTDGTQLAGVTRQVRHAGTYNAGRNVGARAEQKEIVRSVASTKLVMRRAKAFTGLRNIHDNIANANITDKWPLRTGGMVIGLRPVTKKEAPELILGQVVCMYTNTGAKGARHDDIPAIDGLGAASYINIQLYTPSHATSFSSIACSTLGCATFLRLPPTHVLLSLATSQDINRTDINVGASSLPITMISLGPHVMALFRTMRTRTGEINDAVQVSIATGRKGKSDAVPQDGAPSIAVAPQEEDGSEMEEEIDWEQMEDIQ